MADSTSMDDCVPSIASIRDAAAHIKVTRTPVVTSKTMDERSGCTVFFKCELFQRTGSFKFRGASNGCAPDRLCGNATVPNPEVAPCSGALHATGDACRKLAGIKATIVMPENAPAVKRAAVESYGATIVTVPATQRDREEGAARVVRETGATMIPPYDHPDIISGQGTIALELFEQVDGSLDFLIVPVGGGGMLSGVSIAAKTLCPDVQIVAAEPKGADDAYRSITSGEYVPLVAANTIADGLRTSLGAITWPIIRDRVAHCITVSEEEIIAAMRLVWERMKLVIEPSAAVGVAVLLSAEFADLARETAGNLGRSPRVGVVLCGGNVSLDRLPWQN